MSWSTTEASASWSMGSKPSSAAIEAGSPPRSTISGMTVLARCSVTLPSRPSFTGLEQLDLAAGLVLDGVQERPQRVEVLDLASGAELRTPRRPHRDIRVDAQ